MTEHDLGAGEGEQDTLTDDERGLQDVLTEHRTPDNAISSTELSERVGIEQSNGTPEARFAIRSLIKKTGLPIGACSDGYYLITSERQLYDYIERLNSRIEGIETRKSLLIEAFESDMTQQTLAESSTEEVRK